MSFKGGKEGSVDIPRCVVKCHELDNSHGKGRKSPSGILGNNHVFMGWQITWVNKPAILGKNSFVAGLVCCSFSHQKARSCSWFVATSVFASWSHLPTTLLCCLSRLRGSGACLNPDPTLLLPCPHLTCNNALSLTLKLAPCSYESTCQLIVEKCRKNAELLAISEL